MTVFIVHGFNSRKHAVWMSELGRLIEDAGYDIILANYGHTHLFNVASVTEDHAREIAAAALPGDIAVGHSNGCTAIHKACRDHGANLGHLLYLNAALPTDTAPMPWVTQQDVFFAPDELATLAGAIWGTLNFWAGEWGAMGRYGYTGDDERVTNIDLGPVGHSGAMDFTRRERTAQAIIDRIHGRAMARQPLFRS